MLRFDTLLITALAISTVSVVMAQVPPEKQFRVLNEPSYAPYIMEYDADYRFLNSPNQSFFKLPFQLMFYNTTPSAYVLALRVGSRRDMAFPRWIWDANRNNPVGDNSTLSLGRDGNLVLAELDGQVKWQTNTANKGVTGFEILPNGNMVLHDKNGKFVWQSFDHPTDTLLVGQSLKVYMYKIFVLIVKRRRIQDCRQKTTKTTNSECQHRPMEDTYQRECRHRPMEDTYQLDATQLRL